MGVGPDQSYPVLGEGPAKLIGQRRDDERVGVELPEELGLVPGGGAHALDRARDHRAVRVRGSVAPQRRAYDLVRCPLAACAGEIAWRLAVVDQHQIDLPAVLEGAEAVQSVAETLDFPLSRTDRDQCGEHTASLGAGVQEGSGPGESDPLRE